MLVLYQSSLHLSPLSCYLPFERHGGCPWDWDCQSCTAFTHLSSLSCCLPERAARWLPLGLGPPHRLHIMPLSLNSVSFESKRKAALGTGPSLHRLLSAPPLEPLSSESTAAALWDRDHQSSHLPSSAPLSPAAAVPPSSKRRLGTGTASLHQLVCNQNQQVRDLLSSHINPGPTQFP
jgi:hypothetical protein